MNSKVIYTCLTAKYDSLLQPITVDKSFDYICFSNDISTDKIGVWEIRKIPFEIEDSVRLSRMVKLLPHKVLKDYEYSIWIDANLQITQNKFYQIVNSLINDKSCLAQIVHPYRHCIYNEMYVCLKEGRVNTYDTIRQLFHLKKNKYPIENGLYENNIILRKHNDNIIRTINEEWYDEYINYSKRDQFSLCYILWRNNFKPSLLFPEGQNSRNVSFVEYHKHCNQLTGSKLWEYRISKHLGSRLFYLLNYLLEKLCK